MQYILRCVSGRKEMLCGQANDVRPSYSITFVLITTQTQSLLADHQKHCSTRAVGTPEQ